MSEVKNEGLEAVATLTVSFDEGDGGSAIEQVETHTLLDEGAHDLCRHSEALAGYAVRDARIAELEGSGASKEAFAEIAFDLQTQRDQLRAELAALTAKLDASKFCANVADDLRAELSALKAQEPVAWMLKNEKGRIEEILPYMPCASDMQPYWPEPFPLYAAPVAKQVVMPHHVNTGAAIQEVLQAIGIDGDVSYHLAGQVWNACLDEVARLNAADHAEGGV